MAIYSCSVQTMSRSSGRSATAAAAYRSGTEIEDERTGEVHDYRNKGRDGVEESKIILPQNAPENLQNRSELWNAAEASENRKNSVVAREVMVALPHEVDRDGRKNMVDEYAQGLSDRYKVGVDYSIHTPDKKGDQRNHHAHIMMTTRRIDENGFGEKTRELDAYKTTGKAEINHIRESWEKTANKHLELSKSEARIDSRSYEKQGVDKVPTQHVGVAGTAIDRKGGDSERQAINDEIKKLNQQKEQQQAELAKIRAEKENVRNELAALEKEYKSAVKEEKQAERVKGAVDLAHNKAHDMHESKVENHNQYRGYHQHQLNEQGKRIKELNASEPQKKALETKAMFEKRHESWSQMKDKKMGEIHEKIQRHSNPKYSDSADRARGKAAYESKVKKTEIAENFHDKKADKKLTEIQEKKKMIQEKVEAKKSESKGLEQDYKDGQDKVSSVQSKLEERKKELDAEQNNAELEGAEKAAGQGADKSEETEREKIKSKAENEATKEKSKEPSKDDSMGY